MLPHWGLFTKFKQPKLCARYNYMPEVKHFNQNALLRGRTGRRRTSATSPSWMEVITVNPANTMAMNTWRTKHTKPSGAGTELVAYYVHFRLPAHRAIRFPKDQGSGPFCLMFVVNRYPGTAHPFGRTRPSAEGVQSLATDTRCTSQTLKSVPHQQS